MIPHQKLNTSILSMLRALVTPYNSFPVSRFIPHKNWQWTSSAYSSIKSVLLKDYKVGLPSFTCKAVLNAINDSGAKPFFIDSGLVPDSNIVKESLSKIDALIVPHNLGFMADMESIRKDCDDNHVLLIEDCAQALGARYNEHLAGSFGDYSTYSFGISKNIGFSGGLLSSRKTFYSETKKKYPIRQSLTDISKTLSAPFLFNPLVYELWYRKLHRSLEKGEVHSLDCRMSDFAKFVVLDQLKKYDEALALRRKNAHVCMKELNGVVEVVRPIMKNSPSWLYFVFTHEYRDEFVELLRQKKVDVMPLRTFDDLSGNSPEAKKFSDRYLTFSLHRSTNEIRKITNRIREVERGL